MKINRVDPGIGWRMVSDDNIRARMACIDDSFKENNRQFRYLLHQLICLYRLMVNII